MNKTVRNIGIATLVAGALVYPALKLYQYLTANRDEKETEPEEPAPKKKMRVLNHTKHVPHHMAHMSAHNGHANPSVG